MSSPKRSSPFMASSAKRARVSQRPDMEQRYKLLFNTDLPQVGKKDKWPIWLNHCVMRVALDNFCGKCWYERWDQKKGALKSMSDDELEGVLAVGEQMRKGGRELVVEMNLKSLKFRGKKGPAAAQKK